MSAHAILAVKGLRSRGADRQRLADVAKLGNEGWSLYGAPWLQPVAVNGKPAERRSGENKPNPLRSVATGCLRRSMVSRASAVGCHPLREVPPWEGGGRSPLKRQVPR